MGQESVNPAVPPKFAHCARSSCTNIHLRCNGRPVAPNRPAARFALGSPFATIVAAAISPSATLWMRLHRGYYSSSLVSRYGHIIAPKNRFVKRKVEISRKFFNRQSRSCRSPRYCPASTLHRRRDGARSFPAPPAVHRRTDTARHCLQIRRP